MAVEVSIDPILELWTLNTDYAILKPHAVAALTVDVDDLIFWKERKARMRVICEWIQMRFTILNRFLLHLNIVNHSRHYDKLHAFAVFANNLHPGTHIQHTLCDYNDQHPRKQQIIMFKQQRTTFLIFDDNNFTQSHI